MSYEDKLNKAAAIAAIVFSVAIKEAVPERMREIITEDVANDIGIGMAETLIGFFGEDILPVVIEGLGCKLQSDEFLDKVLPKVREALKGLEVGYARPWWARWLGLPGKVRIK